MSSIFLSTITLSCVKMKSFFVAGRQKIYQTLKSVFGFESFRPGQLETVERILRGKTAYCGCALEIYLLL